MMVSIGVVMCGGVGSSWGVLLRVDIRLLMIAEYIGKAEYSFFKRALISCINVLVACVAVLLVHYK